MDGSKKPLKDAFKSPAKHPPRGLTGLTNKHRDANRDPSRGMHEDALGPFVGIERGTRHVSRFKVYLKTGRVLSVPYAYLPLVDYDPEDALTIKSNELEIMITGRSLEILCDHFNEEKVLWIKESGSGMDDEEAPVFIAGISLIEKE